MTGEGGATAASNRSRSIPKNLSEAFGLSWRSAPRLCVALIAFPLLQSLLIGAQLLLIQQLGQHALGSDKQPAEIVRDMVPVATLMVVALVALLALDNLQSLIRELLTERVRQVSARRMHRAIGQLDLIDFEYPETHDRVMRASTTDFRPAQVVRSLATILNSLVRIVVVTAVVVVIEPLLVPALLALAAPVLLLSRLLAGDRYDFLARMTGLERRRLYYSQLLTARRPAAESRAFGLSKRFSQRYDELSSQRLAELRSVLGRQWRRMLAGQAAFALMTAGGVVVLGWFFASGRSDLGALIAAAVGLAQVANMIGGLSWPASELAEAGLFLADQREFLHQIERRQPTTEQVNPAPKLRTLTIENASFTYPSGSRPALDKVSLTIESGQIVALVGPNGSGKTTLAKIIGMLYSPDEGMVLWNGMECGALGHAALRRRIATVFQDYQTYAESIRDNVAFGAVDQPVDDDRIAWALKAAGFAEQELDLDRMLGPEHEGGTDLSGGQQQRLAIARALYRDADLLILDEPMSALDARAEHTLLAELRTMRRTTVLVSHRLANVAEADLILVFGAGRVIEEGTHEELMAHNGVYRELYQLQANLYSQGEGEISLSYGSVHEPERGRP